MRLSGKKMVKVNVNVVTKVRGHAPPRNFENRSSQKSHFLHSESLSCLVNGIFTSQFLTIISKQKQELPARIFSFFFSVSVIKRVRLPVLCYKI